MSSAAALNWKAVLVRFNHIGRERPRNFDKLKRALLQAPQIMCPLAVEIAIEDVGPVGQALAEVLREEQDASLALRVYEVLPDRLVTLAQAAVEATRQCLAAVIGGTAGGEDLERGSLLNNLAVRLASMGEYPLALKAARAAATFYRQRAKADAAGFKPHLAAALTTLAVREADCGRSRPALAVAKEALALCARLARDNPTLHAGALALALMTLSNRHSTIGNLEEALRLMRQASERYGVLAETDARYAYDHALSLLQMANRLTEQGRHEDALEPAEAAVMAFQRLEARVADDFRQMTAAALTTLAVNLSDCGQPARALASAQASVERFQKLYQLQPSRFLTDLVSALNTLAECQTDMGQPVEALRTARRTVVAASVLRGQMGARATPYLTMALTNLAHRALLLGRSTEACRAAKQSVGLCRIMVRRRPELQPELANALIHWAESLRVAKAWPQAFRAARQAVSLLRPMARQNLGAFGPRFGSALGTMARCEAEAGNRRLALRYQRERVGINRRLCKLSALTHEPGLAIGLANLSLRLLECERPDEALKAVQESLALFEKITAKAPERHREEMAVALEIAARMHAANGHHEIAVQLLDRANLGGQGPTKSRTVSRPRRGLSGMSSSV
jgi:tetratricopeptide (TPR) repeat protein